MSAVSAGKREATQWGGMFDDLSLKVAQRANRQGLGMPGGASLNMHPEDVCDLLSDALMYVEPTPNGYRVGSFAVIENPLLAPGILLLIDRGKVVAKVDLAEGRIETTDLPDDRP